MAERGMQHVPEDGNRFFNALEALEEERWRLKASGRTEEVTVLPDMTFAKSGWQFKDPLTGEKYVESFMTMSEEELRDVACVFFYRLQELQQKVAKLEVKINLLENPALQLVG